MSFSLSLISKYRTELMGIAMLEIMFGHFAGWIGLDWPHFQGSLGWIESRITCLVNTPGFLLLSGLGLYYSYTKNSSVKSFYKRRVQRMWLPYMIMAIPLVAIICCVYQKYTIFQYLGWVTAIGYWCPGNSQYCNMWYIGMSLACYTFFPFIYGILFKRNGEAKCYVFMRLVLTILFSILLTWSISHFFPKYYSLVFLSIPKSVVFITGGYMGYLCKKGLSIPFLKICLTAVVLFSFFFVMSRFEKVFFDFAEFSVYLISIPIVCVVIDKLKDTYVMRMLVILWSWFGKYTLELYVLHIMIWEIVRTYNMGSAYINAIIPIVISVLLCIPINKLTTRIASRVCK